MGARNKWSIAWAIAEAYATHGAKLALTYQGERDERKVRELAEQTGAILMPCDVSDSGVVQATFDRLREEFGQLDVLVHAIAYANKDELSGDYAQTSREGYMMAQEISVFSFVETARYAAAMMRSGGSIQTLTYIGAERTVQNYNVMGVAKAALEASVRYLAVDMGKHNIRVNAISAGPLKTLAAQGISDFDVVLRVVEERAPMHRNITQDEVADVSVFLASDLSRAITGDIIHVDAGFHAVGI
jgi:enoyl-[acyl-carrier protein] reductase I